MFLYKGEISSKPRMTQRDSWKKRPAVVKYYAFKDAINLEANLQGFSIHESIEVVVGVEMPKSWSNKKKNEYDGLPHQQRPDIDNYLKAILDTLCKEDSYVHSVVAKKVWSKESFILIKNIYGKETRFDFGHYIEINKG